MYMIEIALLLISAIRLVAGYRKANCNLMLAAAIFFFLSTAVHTVVDGLL